jgi:hypothetical protein
MEERRRKGVIVVCLAGGSWVWGVISSSTLDSQYVIFFAGKF